MRRSGPSWPELGGTIITALPNFAEAGIIRLAAGCLATVLPLLLCIGSAASWYIWDWKGDVLTYSLLVAAAFSPVLGIWMWRAAGKIDDIEKIQRLYEDPPGYAENLSLPEPPIQGVIEDRDQGVIDV